MSARLAVALVAAAVGLAACGAPPPKSAAPAVVAPGPNDYAAPPDLTGAVRVPGGVRLSGTAVPQARIRLAAPDGTASGATASATGAWSLTAAVGVAPRLYSLSQDIGGRVVRARGYIAVLPAPARAAAMVRPGAGAQVAGPGSGLAISAVDFDRAGAAVVSGFAPAQAPVRLILDGAEAGEGRANAEGRFAITLSDPIGAAGHQLTVQSGAASAGLAFDAGRSAPIATPPLSAARGAGSWRLDWMTPGGGVQSTILADPHRPAAGAAG